MSDYVSYHMSFVQDALEKTIKQMIFSFKIKHNESDKCFLNQLIIFNLMSFKLTRIVTSIERMINVNNHNFNIVTFIVEVVMIARQFVINQFETLAFLFVSNIVVINHDS